MKRILLWLLLLANLFSGMAFAWDDHPEALAGHEQVVFDRPATESRSHGHDHPVGGEWEHAHHCCHGAAHLVGFVNEPAASIPLGGGTPLPTPSAALISLPVAPHLRPPIS